MSTLAVNIDEQFAGLVQRYLESNPKLREFIPHAPIVAIAAAMYPNPDGADKARLTAALDAARGWRDQGIPFIVVLGPNPDKMEEGSQEFATWEDVKKRFEEVGALVVPACNPGLYTQYRDAALIIRALNPKAHVVKAEPEKDLASSIAAIFHALEDGADVVVGERSAKSWASMPEMLRRTERQLYATYCARLPMLPSDMASGVVAYSPRGLEVFLGYDQMVFGNSWEYLIEVPYRAESQGLNVVGAPIDLVYHEGVVEEEAGSPAFAFKRLLQLLLMLEVIEKVMSAAGPGTYFVQNDNTDADLKEAARLIAAATKAGL